MAKEKAPSAKTFFSWFQLFVTCISLQNQLIGIPLLYFDGQPWIHHRESPSTDLYGLDMPDSDKWYHNVSISCNFWKNCHISPFLRPQECIIFSKGLGGQNSNGSILSFHINEKDHALGHTLVVGESGRGKTGLMSYLLACSLKASPSRVFTSTFGKFFSCENEKKDVSMINISREVAFLIMSIFYKKLVG